MLNEKIVQVVEQPYDPKRIHNQAKALVKKFGPELAIRYVEDYILTGVSKNYNWHCLLQELRDADANIRSGMYDG